MKILDRVKKPSQCRVKELVINSTKFMRVYNQELPCKHGCCSFEIGEVSIMGMDSINQYPVLYDLKDYLL